jgi:hypothetical protein
MSWLIWHAKVLLILLNNITFFSIKVNMDGNHWAILGFVRRFLQNHRQWYAFCELNLLNDFLKCSVHLHCNFFLIHMGLWVTFLIFEISDLMFSDWVSFLTYPNLLGIKGFVVVVVGLWVTFCWFMAPIETILPK